LKFVGSYVKSYSISKFVAPTSCPSTTTYSKKTNQNPSENTQITLLNIVEHLLESILKIILLPTMFVVLTSQPALKIKVKH